MSCTLQPLKPDLLKVWTPASNSRSRTSWDDILTMELNMTGHLKISRGPFTAPRPVESPQKHRTGNQTGVMTNGGRAARNRVPSGRLLATIVVLGHASGTCA